MLSQGIRGMLHGCRRAARVPALQMVARVNYADESTIQSPPQTPLAVPRLNLSPRPANYEQQAAPTVGLATQPQKLVARIYGTPRLMFKSDLLWLLKGCNLKPEDLTVIYDSKFRTKFFQMQLDSESFRLAQKAVVLNSRFGGGFLKMTLEEFRLDETNKMLGAFRGRSLLMAKVPTGAMTEAVERFFSGYSLDHSFPIKFLRPLAQSPATGNQSSTPAPKVFETRALVRFKTALEALRALREKQGSVCMEQRMDLQFIE